MPKLFAGNYKKIDDHTVEITVQKTHEQEDKSREYVRKTDDHIKKYVRMQGSMKKSPTQNNVEVKRPL